MQRLLSLLAALVLSASTLHAGGPPRLVLPIDGVSADNAADCAARLRGALGDRLADGRREGVAMKQYEGRHYAVMTLRRDVKLSEVEAALEGSRFSVPRQRLRLFGMAVVDTRGAEGSAQSLAQALQPRPTVVDGASSVILGDRNEIEQDIFRRWDQARERGQQSEVLQQTTTYPQLVRLLKQHGSQLTDIRWRMRYACRMFGALDVK